MERKLTTILAADVVGYSALMEADEAGTRPPGNGPATMRAGLGCSVFQRIFATSYQGTASPRQSKNPPFASTGSLSTTARRWRDASAGVWTSNPFAAKGAENIVATVPGCKATQIPSGDRRANSKAAVLTSWLRAAFEARYAYQPPSRLSPMLPTLADNVAKTALPDRGNRGSTCFMISAGPIAFRANARARLPASS